MNTTTKQASHLQSIFPLLITVVALLAGPMLFGSSIASADEVGLTQTKIYMPIILNEYPPIPKLSSDKTVINIDNGQCTMVRWEFIGAESVEINRGKGFQKRSAPLVGSMEVCPSIRTVFEATAIYPDRTETLQTTVGVVGSGCNRDPYVHQFNPTTTQVDKDEGITVTWDVRCNTETYLQLNDSPEHHVQDFDQKSYFMHTSHYFQLRVTKVVNGATVFEEKASFGVSVRP